MANLLLSVAVALLVIIVGYLYFNGGPDVQSSKDPDSEAKSGRGAAADDDDGEEEGSLLAVMAKNNKKIVVIYGSQTGTAEDFAHKLSKEITSRFGVGAMPADPENFDISELEKFGSDKLAIFLMASYGEGEPTDNAVEMMSALADADFELDNLTFAAFGLGNTSYEFYNQVGKDLFAALERLNAHALLPLGLGDDSSGKLEDDFLSWKDQLFEKLVSELHLTEHDAVYTPAIEILETGKEITNDVYLGEPNLKHLQASTQQRNTNAFVQPKGPYTPSNPLLAKVTETYELFNQAETDRHCVHMELDVSGLKYETGDHVAFWCSNPDAEIAALAKALGLTDLNRVVAVRALDTTVGVRIPSPTTYDTILRHFLEINGPVSRQVLQSLAPFAPTNASREAARKLSTDRQAFSTEVAGKYETLSHLLLKLSNGEPWKSVPFSLIVEALPHLQPRFYSISSSSLESPTKLTITAVVEREKIKGIDHEVRGVATNEILAIHDVRAGKIDRSKAGYRLGRPARTEDNDLRVAVHVRRSLFKLPRNSKIPLIMVGPGTGVAPFRGFVRERAEQKKRGTEVGPALLFCGSRSSKQDFLYPKEWPQHDWLDVHAAFSREGSEKVYVQHLMKQQKQKVNELLEQGAVFYVCGDASRMARDVHKTLLEIIAEVRGISEEEAEAVVRKMRSRNKYLEDVW